MTTRSSLLNFKSSPPPPPKTQTYRNYNAELFTPDLASEAESLLSIFDESDVGSKLNIVDNVLLSVLNLHAFMKSVKIQSRPCPFLNQEIKDLMKSIETSS